MDLPPFMKGSTTPEIKTIEMHTTGEPTRVVYYGFPDLTYAVMNTCQTTDRPDEYSKWHSP